MTEQHFKSLSGMDQFTAIRKGHPMPKWWARAFIREQGMYHRAYWTTAAHSMFNEALGILS